MLKPIENSEEHSTYLARAYDPIRLELVPDSKESDELEAISILIEYYDRGL